MRNKAAVLGLCLLATACSAKRAVRNAIEAGQLGTVKGYVEGGRVNANTADECGITLLHLATYYGHGPSSSISWREAPI